MVLFSFHVFGHCRGQRSSLKCVVGDNKQFSLGGLSRAQQIILELRSLKMTFKAGCGGARL